MLLERFQEISACLPSNVKLLAVSKGHPVESICSLADIGQADFGESRLQEALPKLKVFEETQSIRWHFIGRLQSNKVRSVVRSFDFIHSVDSLALAERISRISLEEQRCPQIMLQVKFCEDPTKGGFAPDKLIEDWSRLLLLDHIRIVGLMTMAPIRLELNERKALFSDCRGLANQFNLPECSMGMSNDWQQALQAGATWLRLGSSLFGKRSNHVNSPTDIPKSG